MIDRTCSGNAVPIALPAALAFCTTLCAPVGSVEASRLLFHPDATMRMDTGPLEPLIPPNGPPVLKPGGGASAMPPEHMECDVDDEAEGATGSAAGISTPPPGTFVVDLAVSVAGWTEHFADAQQVINYLNGLYRGVNGIYIRDAGIRFRIVHVQLWTGNPYTGMTNLQILIQMLTQWGPTGWSLCPGPNCVDRDIVQQLILTGGGSGLGVLDPCGYGRNSVARVDASARFGRGLHWTGHSGRTLKLVAHELGHQLGAPHTHCLGPTPLDHCRSVPRPDCYQGPTSCPPLTEPSEIMSYCYSVPGCPGFDDLSVRTKIIRFHPVMAEYMRSVLATIGGCIDLDPIDCRGSVGLDSDGDGIANACDVCPGSYDSRQQDDTHTGVGNRCKTPLRECFGDLNGNGVVEMSEYLAVASTLSANQNSATADWTGSGSVGPADLPVRPMVLGCGASNPVLEPMAQVEAWPTTAVQGEVAQWAITVKPEARQFSSVKVIHYVPPNSVIQDVGCRLDPRLSATHSLIETPVSPHNSRRLMVLPTSALGYASAPPPYPAPTFSGGIIVLCTGTVRTNASPGNYNLWTTGPSVTNLEWWHVPAPVTREGPLKVVTPCTGDCTCSGCCHLDPTLPRSPLLLSTMLAALAWCARRRWIGMVVVTLSIVVGVVIAQIGGEPPPASLDDPPSLGYGSGSWSSNLAEAAAVAAQQRSGIRSAAVTGTWHVRDVLPHPRLRNRFAGEVALSGVSTFSIGVAEFRVTRGRVSGQIRNRDTKRVLAIFKGRIYPDRIEGEFRVRGTRERGYLVWLP